jgi:DNA (cytosine-5)-methyltransferase 1
VPIQVFDFFSGCGGTSAGLRAAGMEIVLGIDNDAEARKTFERNFPEADFICKDINKVETRSIDKYTLKKPNERRLFSCCAPCQSFSILNRNRNVTDDRARLLRQFSRFVRYYLPEFIFLENVPGVQNIDVTKGPFVYFERLLRRLGYHMDYGTVESQSYGVPQKRKRFVLIASLLGEIEIPPATHGPGAMNPNFPTVWDLPPIAAGETNPDVPNHQAHKLSDLNLRRIMATPVGGGRLSWPNELVLKCHKGDYEGHTDVYGRMRKDEPATGLTTRCTSLSNGRFGHPEQHRAISAREAACIQTFSRDFVFEGSLTSVARQIGNAVPVLMAKRFGEYFIEHSQVHDG